MSVAENLKAVRERIARTGRDPDEVTIVAVTKGFGADRCLEAIAAGLTTLGENRVQEALEKMEHVEAALAAPAPTPDWHLIGHLQTNKARLVTRRFALVQSLDSIRLAELLARHNPDQAVLLEVNVAREPQKSGVAPETGAETAIEVARLLDLRGFMCVGPANADPTPAFRELQRIRDTAEQRLGRSLPILSMGMSGDFEAALAAGSTMLRLGRLLFGPRPA